MAFNKSFSNGCESGSSSRLGPIGAVSPAAAGSPRSKVCVEGETPRAHSKHSPQEPKLAKEKSSGPNKPQANKEVEVKEIDSFDDMGLPNDVLRGIYGYGFEKPSNIQMRGIKPMAQGNDMLVQASAGAGKTGCFVIGLLSNIDTSSRVTQGLILAPVRELAKQTYDVTMALSQYMKGFKTYCCRGGTSVRNDIRALREGQQVVIGTPGRLLHMIREKYLQIDQLRTIILDEADELLSRGFQDAIYDVFQYVPQNVQACLFSATIPDEIVRLSNKFLRPNKVSIRVQNKDLTRIGDIKQFYLDVENDQWKLQTLMDLYAELSVNQSIIFTNTKDRCDRLYEDLERNDFTCTVIHGGMEQSQRNLAIEAFKSGSSRVLLSTGLIKRGMDFQSVNLVINYDLPMDKHLYIHAVGRVGRYGRKGVAINFVAGHRDVDMMKEIEEHYNTQIDEMPCPEEIMKHM